MKQPLSIRRLLVAGTLIVVGLIAMRMWLTPVTSANDEPVINITYPYAARPERERQIRDGFKRVQTGASASEVSALLGVPDEVHPRYEPWVWEPPGRRPPRIGTTYWYFLEKQSADNNKNAKVVRVSFDLNEQVIDIDHWGFDEGKRTAE